MKNQQMIKELWQTLHECPEISGQEVKTKKILIDFLLNHTSLEVYPCGDGFYAAHREVNTKKTSIAVRADYDAVSVGDGKAAHLCGHDGHAATLCGVALLIEGKVLNRNVFLLFQPAEETGEGAKKCLELFEKENVDEIYGVHNLPGVPFGQVMTKPGIFACASRGLTIELKGKPAHAAYPENGISPANCVGELLSKLPDMTDSSKYKGMTLCTVIGVTMGQKAFGMAAADAQVWLTLRAEYEADLLHLQEQILELIEENAKREVLTFSYQLEDVFPETNNDEECAKKVLDVTGGTNLEVPMRWSEDFGHYLKVCKGAFLGIGAGTDCPNLHTKDYCYPLDLSFLSIEKILSILYS